MKLVYRFERACGHCGATYQTNANYSKYCAECAPLASSLQWQRHKQSRTPEQRAKRLRYFRSYYQRLPAAKLAEKRERSRQWQETKRRALGVPPRQAVKTDPRKMQNEKLMAMAREEARRTGQPRYVVLERMGAPAEIVERWFLREGA